MTAVRDLLFLFAICAVAIAVALAVHPLFAVFFLLAAKIIAIFGASAVEAYRITRHEKRKRRHLLTADGETLEIADAAANADEVILSHREYHA